MCVLWSCNRRATAHRRVANSGENLSQAIIHIALENNGYSQLICGSLYLTMHKKVLSKICIYYTGTCKTCTHSAARAQIDVEGMLLWRPTILSPLGMLAIFRQKAGGVLHFTGIRWIRIWVESLEAQSIPGIAAIWLKAFENKWLKV